MTFSPIESAIYEGQVFHERFGPHANHFQMRLFMLYLDLEELPELFGRSRLWSYQGPNLASVQRSDYLQPANVPLGCAVRQAMKQSVGWDCDGPIRLLTHGRFLGHCFNPVSLYYCFDRDAVRPRCVLAEVTNTPWHERHAYVLELDWANGASAGTATVDKVMHVSPFFDLDGQYRWRVAQPGRQLHVAVDLVRHKEVTLRAGLHLRRRPWKATSLDRIALTYPAMAARVVMRIYWQALGLWLFGAPFHVHPRKARDRGASR
ncbi:MAG: DUF1365 domain-containing protein [Myxococcales bacterium]|nr:DUF1365 domain-containing protein [Myxococcales bacterium]